MKKILESWWGKVLFLLMVFAFTASASEQKSGDQKASGVAVGSSKCAEFEAAYVAAEGEAETAEEGGDEAANEAAEGEASAAETRCEDCE